MNLVEHTFKEIKAHRWISKGDCVLVAVSAGADSVALLHVLYRLRHRLGIDLQVVHCNHRLRKTSDRDELFVRELCQKLNIQLHVKRQYKNLKTRSVSEDEARKQRYQFFKEISQKTKVYKIVLAHHQNDLAETVLMRIIRGSGLMGLRGILSLNQLGKLALIRPFLTVSRKNIESYLKQQKLKFCVDETNLATMYLRNKIRLELLPLLTNKYNKNFSNVLLDLSQNSQEDYDYLSLQAEKLFNQYVIVSKGKIKIKHNVFLKEHPSMRRMILRLAFSRLVSNVNQLSFSHIQEVEEMLLNRPVQSEVHWPQGVRVFKKAQYVELLTDG